MRRTFIRWRKAAGLAAGVFQTLDQQPAHGAHFIELPALFIELLVEALHGIFQAHELELYFY